jgi:hypothetical protein
MVTPQDYTAYHIMKAIGGDRISAREIAERYNRWALRSGNPIMNVQRASLLIAKRLSPTYVEVAGVEHPWVKRGYRGRKIYALTAVGCRWVERYAHRWEP